MARMYKPQSMCALTKWLFYVTAAGISATAFARSPKPTLMPLPLEFKQAATADFSTNDREALQREYIRLLRLAGAQVADFAHYEVALKDLKREECERHDDSLAQVAKKAETLYALYASIDATTDGELVVSGRVVRDDGKPATALESVRFRRGADSPLSMVKTALGDLFAQLKIGDLSPTREVELAKVEPAKEPQEPALVTSPPVIQDAGAGQRSVGKALVYSGGAVALVGALVAGAGAGIGYRQDLKQMNVPAGQVETLATAKTLTAVGFVGIGVGALAAGVGAILWGTAAPAPLTQVSVLPMTGGGVVLLGGEF